MVINRDAFLSTLFAIDQNLRNDDGQVDKILAALDAVNTISVMPSPIAVQRVDECITPAVVNSKGKVIKAAVYETTYEVTDKRKPRAERIIKAGIETESAARAFAAIRAPISGGAYIYAAVDTDEPWHDSDVEQIANIANYNVVSGCTLTYDAADLTVDLASGTITHDGSSVTVATAANAYTLVADGSNERWATLTVGSAGTAVLVSGDAAASSSVEPSKPEPGDRVVVGMAKIQAAQTIAANCEYTLDKRVIAPTSDAFDGIRTKFRANRRLVAEYSAWGPSTLYADTAAVLVSHGPAGVGFGQKFLTTDTTTTVGGELIAQFGVGGSATSVGIHSMGGGTNAAAAISPNHSPRMLLRVRLPSASASLSAWLAGFTDSNYAAVNSEGAFLRLATTGNLFFVTDSGGVETVTDLGAYSRTTVVGFEIETADAGVTWVCRSQAGTVLATHTTNVPNAAAVRYYSIASSTSAAVPHGIAYCRVEGTFA